MFNPEKTYSIEGAALQKIHQDRAAYIMAIDETANDPRYPDKPDWQLAVSKWQDHVSCCDMIIKSACRASGIRTEPHGYIGQ